MTRFVAALIALLLASAAAAQNVTVIGPVTPGNVPIFNSTTVIKDSGTAPGGGQTVNWINVKSTCGATGNGVTDDTVAINTCIGQFNSAGNGTLYFPAGTYLTSGALTAITAVGVIRGDGTTNLSGQLGSTPPYTGVAALPGSLILESSCTASLFTINSQTLTFHDLSMLNTCATPSAGAGITVTSNILYQRVNYQRIDVSSFYIDVDVQAGSGWIMSDTNLWNPVLYGLKIRNIVNPDAGGWEVKSVTTQGVNRNGTSGIRWESSGGGLITNIHINGGTVTGQFTNGIDIAAVGNTVNLGIMNGSIENIAGPAIKISGSLPNIWIVGMELAQFAPCSVNCFGIWAANTSFLTISDVIFASGFGGNPINLSTVTNAFVSNITTTGGVSPYGNGAKADHDATGGIGTFFLKDDTTGVESRLDWVGPAGQIPEFRVLLDPGTPNFPAFIAAVNDANNKVGINMNGTTSNPVSTRGKGTVQSDVGLVVMSDAGSTTGGTDDVSIRAGGSGQEAMLVSHNGHVAMAGQGNTAPTLTAGCNGAGSVVSGSDANGTITGQTAAATTCTLSFGTAYSAAPNCAITGLSSPLTGAVTVGTGSIQVNFTSTANYKWSYICHGA